MGIGYQSLDQHCRLPFRSVYDGEEHGRFMEKLEARIRNHDREIEKMCNFHYQGFVDSITELLKVRGEAQKLKVRENPSRCGSGLPDLGELCLSFQPRPLGDSVKPPFPRASLPKKGQNIEIPSFFL